MHVQHPLHDSLVASYSTQISIDTQQFPITACYLTITIEDIVSTQLLLASDNMIDVYIISVVDGPLTHSGVGVLNWCSKPSLNRISET